MLDGGIPLLYVLIKRYPRIIDMVAELIPII